MTGLQLVILGGLLSGCGVVLGVRALRPSMPSLTASLEQLSAEPSMLVAGAATGSTGERWGWLPPSVAVALDAHLDVPDPDLKIIGWTRPQLAARKLALAVAGFVAPSLLGLVMVLFGAGGYVVLPVAIGVAIAVVGWMLPSREARELASNARAEFRTNLEFFLTLVAGERRARGSVEQALDEASAVSGSMPFTQMRQAIRTATLAGRKPWADLRALGEDLDLADLRNLADISDVAADGAPVYNTLLATARTLRHAELSDQRAEANQVSERMSRPLALLVFGLTLFVLVPFMLRMFGIS